jgi:butyrate kinase
MTKTAVKDFLILAVNPGSTSTKISVFHGDEALFIGNVKHDRVDNYKKDHDSAVGKLKAFIMLELSTVAGFDIAAIDAFAARGGGLVPSRSGTYEINDRLIRDARETPFIHPCMLAPQIALELARENGKKAYVVDSPFSDEYEDISRVTGLPEIERVSHLHALNQKEVAHRAAAELGGKYEDFNFIVAHLGGGFSITAHRRGRMVDSTDNIAGEGPMSVNRCGSIPVVSVVDLCFSGKYTKESMYELIMSKSGILGHLGVNDGLVIEKMVKDGDRKAKTVFDAMLHQIAKSIGSMAAVLEGDVRAILLTGGLVRDPYLLETVTRKVRFIAPVKTYPGEYEMEALTNGVLRTLRGQEECLTYTGVPVWSGFDWNKQDNSA